MFKNPDFGSHTQPPILYKDHFYTQYTTNERRDGLVSMSMNGEVKWKTGQSPAFVRGGAILADGLILATDGSKKLYLIEPDPAGFKTLASAELMEAGNNWAPLALSDGKLLIRDQKKLIVVQVGHKGIMDRALFWPRQKNLWVTNTVEWRRECRLAFTPAGPVRAS